MRREELHDNLVFSSPIVSIGEFRCGPAHSLWREANFIRSGHLLVFPRNFVRIRQSGRPPFVSTPNHVVFYNAGQEYTRALISREGDTCEYFAFPAGVIADVIRPFDPSVADRPETPFAFDHGLSDSVAYSFQRLLYETAGGANSTGPINIQERALSLLNHVVRFAYRQRGYPSKRRTARSWVTHQETVERAKAWLGGRFLEPVQLIDIAAAVGVSVFHLCRLFRANVGLPIHRYLVLLRLRAGLEQLKDPSIPLARVSLDLGFCGQSHLTSSLRRETGLTPEMLRRHATSDNIQKLSKIMQEALTRPN